MRRTVAIVAVLVAVGALTWWVSPRGKQSEGAERQTAPVEKTEPKAPPAVRGRVVDAKNEPVQGARISVGAKQVVSGEEGRFELRGLSSGLYEVDVEAEGFVEPGPKVLRTVEVEVPDSHDKRPAELDLTVRRPATLSGKVVADGEPVGGVGLTLLYHYAEGYRGGLEPFALSSEGTSDEDGSFELTGVAPGRLHVLAEPPERATKQTEELLVESGEKIQGLVIDLAPQGVVTGEVTSKSGGPLGAQVVLRGEQLPRDRRVRANDSGRFRIGTLPAGDYRLDVRASGHRSKMLPKLSVDEKKPTEVDVQLEPGKGLFGRVIDSKGEPVRGAVVRMSAGQGQTEWRRTNKSGGFQVKEATDGVWSVRAFSPNHASTREAAARPGESVTLQLGEGGEIRGRVVDASGDPVPGAKLGVGAMVVGGPRPYGQRSIDRQRVENKDGTFTFGPLRPGRYELRARAKGYASSSAPTIEVRPGETVGSLTIVLGRGGTVRGKIVDEETGEPLKDAAVMVLDMTSPFRPRRTKTGQDGTFKLTKVPPGRRSLRVSRKGYLTRLFSGLQISEGGTVRRTIELHEKKKGQRYGFRGIGASLRKTDEGAEIFRVMPGGGAKKNGLKKGDVIHMVDGQPVGNLPLPAIVQKIRGQAGEPVRLSLSRQGRGRFRVEITRGRIVVDRN